MVLTALTWGLSTVHIPGARRRGGGAGHRLGEGGAGGALLHAPLGSAGAPTGWCWSPRWSSWRCWSALPLLDNATRFPLANPPDAETAPQRIRDAILNQAPAARPPRRAAHRVAGRSAPRPARRAVRLASGAGSRDRSSGSGWDGELRVRQIGASRAPKLRLPQRLRPHRTKRPNLMGTHLAWVRAAGRLRPWNPRASSSSKPTRGPEPRSAPAAGARLRRRGGRHRRRGRWRWPPASSPPWCCSTSTAPGCEGVDAASRRLRALGATASVLVLGGEGEGAGGAGGARAPAPTASWCGRVEPDRLAGGAASGPASGGALRPRSPGCASGSAAGWR